MTFDQASQSVTPGDTAAFDETITASATAGGMYTCTVHFLLNDTDAGDAFTESIHVTVNRPPVALDDSATTHTNVPVTIPVLGNDSDPDGDSFTISTFDATTGNGGTVVNNGDGSFTYTPATGFVGTDTFTYTIKDSGGLTATATVTVEVVNQPPDAVDDTATTTKHTTITIEVLNNDTDPDGDALTVTAADSTGTLGGTVVINADGTISYTSPNQAGTDTFTYTISDGAAKDTATVTVTIANQPPVAVDDTASTNKHTTISIPVLVNDSDADGDPITITAVDATSALGGTVVDNGDGTVSYTSPNQAGTDTFTYTISDGTDTDTATVTITIIDLAPDCSAAAPSISVIWPPNHKFVAVNILNVTDPDGDAVTITIDSIYQDEPVNGVADGDSEPDAQGIGTDTAQVRAERAGSKKVPGDGRVYHIAYTASDGEMTCSGEVIVVVPHDNSAGGADVIDEGALYDSTS